MKIDPKWLAFGLSDEQVKGAVILGWRGGVIATLLWSIGAMQPYGLGGFARADEVDAKIAALEQRTSEQMASLKQHLDTTDKKLDDQTEILRQMRVDSVETKLKELQTEWCRTTVRQLKLHLNEQIEIEMRRYQRIAGETYRSRSCEVL